MSVNLSVMEGWIRDLRRLPNVLERVAPEVAGDVQAELTRTLSAGTSPDGQAWAPRKDGGRAYKGAASKLTVTAVGRIIQATIIGPEVWGARGARGAPIRQMLPTEITGRMAQAIKARLGLLWSKHFR